MNIRLARAYDNFAINTIYNQAVNSKFQTADCNPISIEQRNAWFINHELKNLPIFVIEDQYKICGWSSLSIYRDRDAIKKTAEISYYIDQESQRKGYGSKLVSHCIQKAPEFNFTTLIAILLDKNIASIALLKKFNFKEWGRMPNIAIFDKETCDHLYFGLHL